MLDPPGNVPFEPLNYGRARVFEHMGRCNSVFLGVLCSSVDAISPTFLKRMPSGISHVRHKFE